jgi:hypothetical protein
MNSDVRLFCLLHNDSFALQNAEFNDKRLMKRAYFEGLMLPRQKKEIKQTISHYMERENDHSPPPNAVVKSGGGYTSTPSYVFMACCLIN